MKPLFYKLPFEQRSHLLDTIYTATLAINLLFLQSLLSASSNHMINVALINFSVGIPGSAGAVIARRIHQSSTPIDRTLGSIALLNTVAGVTAALWRFSPEISLTFIGSAFMAAILVIIGHNLYPVPSQSDNHQTAATPLPEYPPSTPHQEQKRRKRK